MKVQAPSTPGGPFQGAMASQHGWRWAGWGRRGPAGGRGRRPSCCLCLCPGLLNGSRLEQVPPPRWRSERRGGCGPGASVESDPSRPAGSEGLGPSRVILALGTAGPVAPGVTHLQAAALGYSQHPASWMGRSRGFLTSGPGTGPCTCLVAQLVKNPPA